MNQSAANYNLTKVRIIISGGGASLKSTDDHFRVAKIERSKNRVGQALITKNILDRP